MLTEETETRESDDKVRCVLCLTYNLASYGGKWISPSSFRKSHKKTDIHKDSVIRQEAEARRDKELARGNMELPPQSFATPEFITPPTPAHALYNQPPASINKMQALWDAHTNEIPDCSMNTGPENIEDEERTKFYRKMAEYGVWDGYEEEENDNPIHQVVQSWEAEEQDDVLTDILQNLALADKDGAPEDTPNENEKAEWFPYPSKVMFLLNTIDNLPRHRISSTLMKVILWLLSEVGLKRVPSFDALRTFQTSLRKENSIATTQWKSSKGNVFSFNDPQALILNDWANPLTCPHIRRYPVLPRNGVISEIWHAQKWHRHLDRDVRSPMYDAGNDRHYFIDEPAALNSGELVVPVRWLEDEDGAVWMEVWTIVLDAVTGKSTILDDAVTLMKADMLRSNMLDLVDENIMPAWCDLTIKKEYPQRMPNPDRALANGDPMYTCFIDIFGDDVSGNRSKSWNKHWNVYMNHRNLPRKLLFQQYHTHFLSTSTHATVPEQFEGIKSRIDATHVTPIVARHGISGKTVKLKLYCNCAPGDNPSQSETSGHIGGNGNYPCRKCNVGGTQKEKESNHGFHSLFTPGDARSAKDTLEKVEEQIAAACTGIADKVGKLQTATGIKDGFAQHWIEDLIDRSRSMKKSSPTLTNADIQTKLLAWAAENRSKIHNPFLLSIKGFDASLDTPVEILHTILLGIAKYSWHSSHTSWDSKKKQVFSARLQATNTASLSIPPIRSSYIMQYANSLIGRQLKTLVQVTAFCAYDLVDCVQYDLIKAIGELSALLWFPEIHNMDQYLDDVDTAAANVLDIAAKVDASKIIAKIKYHLLAHLRQDILRFGPLVGVASEIFECFNAIFRFCSIFSNHISPSRDIAHQLAGQETVKHLLSGGWWYSTTTKDWKKPGPRVQSYITSNSVLQHLCGWVENPLILPGSVKLMPNKRDKITKKLIQRKALSWDETLASKSFSGNTAAVRNEHWYCCKSAVSSKGDECHVGSWIFAKSPFAVPTPDGKVSPITGRITEILQDTKGKSTWLVLEVYSIAAQRHKLYGMPILLRRLGESTTVVVSTHDILFDYNVQHDCSVATCAATGSKKIVQERNETDKLEECIEHNPVDQYLINMHAFHNANFVRGVLPRSLAEPLPYTSHREAYHHEIASKFRNIQDGKRETQARKAAEKKAKAVDVEGLQLNEGGQNKRKRSKPNPTSDSHSEPAMLGGLGGADGEDHGRSMVVD